METASLVISVLALIAAAYSVWYARHQAQSSSASLDLEKDRRTDELTPEFSILIKREPRDRGWLLILTLESPRPLAWVKFRPITGFTFTNPPEIRVGELQDVPPGVPFAWGVALHRSVSGPARVRLECADHAGRLWELLPTVELPPPPSPTPNVF